MSRPSRLALVAAFAAIYFIWGSTYLAIRFGVAAIPPFLLASVRFLVGGVAFTAWAWSRGAARPTVRDWVTTGVIGVLMAAGGNGLVSWALQTVQSGLGALLVSLVPLWIALIDWLTPGGRRPTGRVTLGLLLGFGGVALLIDPTDIGGMRQVDPVGAGTIAVASLLWATGSIYSRHARQPSSQALSSGMQMLGGGVVLMGMSAATGEFSRLDLAAVPPGALVAWAYTIVFGSVAYGSSLWRLKASTPAKASTYAYVNPVIALLLGYLFGAEVLSAWTVGCSVMIVAAVLLVVSD
jgi:drug/metabolite transporter (DMT)-like permease